MRALQLLSVLCVCVSLFVLLWVSEGTICVCVFVHGACIIVQKLSGIQEYPLVHSLSVAVSFKMSSPSIKLSFANDGFWQGDQADHN